MNDEPMFKPFCAVYVVLVKKTKVLLLKRTNIEFPGGYFTLPASHVNENQSLTQNASYVLFTQTGASIPSNKIKLSHVSYRKIGERVYTDFLFSVVASEWDEDQLINKQPDMCDGLEWFQLHELPDTILPNLKTSLLDMEQGLSFREFGWED